MQVLVTLVVLMLVTTVAPLAQEIRLTSAKVRRNISFTCHTGHSNRCVHVTYVYINFVSS